LVSSKAQGQGVNHTRRIREWILKYLRQGELPYHRLGQGKWTALEDKDITREIKLRLTEKARGRYIKASDVVEVVVSPEFQVILKAKGLNKPSILECTAWCWLAGLGWRYGKTKTGMYIDGHK
jgi:hypothetical protein